VLSDRNLYLPGDGPHKGRELAGDGGDGNIGVFATRDETAESLAETHLGLPGDVLDGLGEFFETLLEKLGDLGWEAVGPGALDEGAAGMAVAGLGDGALAALFSGGVLTGDKAEEGGELSGGVEASEVADFSEGGGGDGLLDAAQGLDGFDDRVKAPGGEVLGELGFEALEAVDLFADGTEGFLEDDLLGGGGADDFGQVAQMGVVPVGLAGVVEAEAQEERLQALFGGFEVTHGVLASAAEVANGFILDRGDVDGGKISGA